MSNFFIRLNILLNRFLMLLGLRRQNMRWGIVYDSVSKEPLDPVIVRLIDVETGKATQTSVTDLAGRYNFLAYPGKFKILVRKSNYNYPSVISAGDHDEIYSNLYHGEFFTLTGGSDVINFNIPMDPGSADWNQQAKQPLMNFSPYAENLLFRLASALFWFVLALAGLSLFYHYTKVVYWVLIFYGVVFFLALFLPRPRWWGMVRLKQTGEPAAGNMLELSYAQMPTVSIARANIYDDGKFFVRLDPGRYVLRILQPNEGAQSKVLYEKKVRVGGEHVVNQNFTI